jgi:leucyl-tRNA synthetase
MEIDRYVPAKIEDKWRKRWEENKTFEVDLKRAKKPFYNLMMFPYPSGEGLHVGHVYAFGGSDTYGRFKRLQGWDVFEPMGFDSFGIHSENYAIKQRIHPKKLIEKTTSYFKEKQLKRLGGLFDWDHQVTTSDPDYYRWTQWLFVQLFKVGLVERKKAPVDWCPSCKTVLADEQVMGGRCERCGAQVIQKELEQWFFKITNYAEKLLKNLGSLPSDVYGPKTRLDEKARQVGINWSDSTKTMQRNWIGRSEGTIIEFKIKNSKLKIPVFTTRPDTIFGATFMVLAPDHELAEKLSSAKSRKAVHDYIEESRRITELERTQAKSGVFTGSYCINPFTKKEIPILIADYVLMGYGTGAIMGVPAHDLRDYDFAKKYKLPIVEVIGGGDIQKEAYIGEGRLVNSGQFNGLNSLEAIGKVSNYIEKENLGRKTVNYHLRDWLISRQRYWGPPIPMIYCEECAKEGESWFTTDEAKKYQVSSIKYQEEKEEKILNTKYKIQDTDAMRGWYPVSEEDLPVLLPQLEDYQPRAQGTSPLATLPDFLSVKCSECGKDARRETDVSDTFLDSSWYYLRYPSVGIQNSELRIKNSKTKSPWDTEITKKWLPVDMYIGGNEHAVMHLLYARFITMALHDIGLVDFAEPFRKFRAHGLIIRGGAKMSKSRGNVVNPNEYMDAYGSDALRMYLLFIGSYDLGGDFSDRAIVGVYRFLNRVWQLVNGVGNSPANSVNASVAKEINKLVKKVGEDVETLKFNTAIAAIMEFANFAVKHKEEIDQATLKKFLIALSIFAPFTAEELWSRLGEKTSVHNQTWPAVEKEFLQEEKATIAVQVDGKLRDTIRMKNEELRIKNKAQALALVSEKVKKHVGGKAIKKIIYVPGKIVSIVTGGK